MIHVEERRLFIDTIEASTLSVSSTIDLEALVLPSFFQILQLKDKIVFAFSSFEKNQNDAEKIRVVTIENGKLSGNIDIPSRRKSGSRVLFASYG